MEKTFTIVGVSTLGKITKFRVANGDMAARIKVLDRGGHTDINFIELASPMGKMEAIAEYKSQHPETADVRMPNQKDDKPAGPAKVRTVSVKTSGRKVTDAANELLKAVEEA
jgi:hypothetical protein